MRLLLERTPPRRSFRHRIGARPGQNRNADHSGADQSQREQPVGTLPGQWAQRFGSLPGGRNLILAVRMKSGRSSQDDKVHHEVGEEHPGEHVSAAPPQLLVGCALALGGGPSHGAFLFHFLRRLPKK